MALGLTRHRRSILPDSHWQALDEANAELIDRVIDDLQDLVLGARVVDFQIASYLPPAHLHRYDDAFLRQLLLCLASVGLKLHLPGVHPLACTAEEIALYAMRMLATEILTARGEVADFGAWECVALKDTDHEDLYNPALDGFAEDPLLGAMLGPVNLTYDVWFLRFEAGGVVHPYLTCDGELGFDLLADDPNQPVG
jgi:hypothetical protein